MWKHERELITSVIRHYGWSVWFRAKIPFGWVFELFHGTKEMGTVQGYKSGDGSQILTLFDDVE